MSSKIITAVAGAFLLSSTTLASAQTLVYPQYGYGAQSACYPVASWTDLNAAICIKYVCAGGGFQIRCLPAPVLGCTGPGGPYPCM
jgi:hypothetical protein